MQLFQDPSRTGQIFRPLVMLHQLFNDRRINPRLLAFLALLFLLLLHGHFHSFISDCDPHTKFSDILARYEQRYFHTIGPPSTQRQCLLRVANVINHRHAFGLVDNHGTTKRPLMKRNAVALWRGRTVPVHTLSTPPSTTSAPAPQRR